MTHSEVNVKSFEELWQFYDLRKEKSNAVELNKPDKIFT